MMGNAQEWTSQELIPYPDSPARRDDAFQRDYIAVRGGSYAVVGRTMSLASRSGYAADSQYGIGFRCAKDAQEESPAEESPSTEQ
jgi:formylglycine-generating enzyme required for sulfatase activity